MYGEGSETVARQWEDVCHAHSHSHHRRRRGHSCQASLWKQKSDFIYFIRALNQDKFKSLTSLLIHMFLKFYYKILGTHKVSCDMYVSNKVSTSEPSIQLKKQSSIQTSTISRSVSLNPFLLLFSCDPVSNFVWSLDFFMVLPHISVSSNNQIYPILKFLKRILYSLFFTPFTPSILFLRFMHWLQNQTFWACIQALPRNCWVALSKLANFTLLQLFSCKIGII